MTPVEILSLSVATFAVGWALYIQHRHVNPPVPFGTPWTPIAGTGADHDNPPPPRKGFIPYRVGYQDLAALNLIWNKAEPESRCVIPQAPPPPTPASQLGMTESEYRTWRASF